MLNSLRSYLTLILITCVLAPSIHAQPQRPAPNHGPLDSILKDTVKDERVDYLAIRKDHWDSLNTYLLMVKEVPVSSLAKADALAFYFNVYNASMIKAVIEVFHAGYSPEEDSWAIFDKPFIKLGSKTISLNHLENEILRKEFKEPRLHVALVCGARSCPPLIPRAYRGDDLDSVLNENMTQFLKNPLRNRVDSNAKTLSLSKIFEWYAADFGGVEKLGSFADAYIPGDVSQYEVSFLEYSWKLNIHLPSEGRWTVLKSNVSLRTEPNGSELTKLTQGRVFEVLLEKDSWLRIARPFEEGEGWIPATAGEEFVGMIDPSK